MPTTLYNPINRKKYRRNSSVNSYQKKSEFIEYRDLFVYRFDINEKSSITKKLLVCPSGSDDIELVIGSKIYHIDRRLSKIAQEIKDSQELLNLPEDWDLQDAKPINTNAYFATLNFLIDYSSYILTNFKLPMI